MWQSLFKGMMANVQPWLIFEIIRWPLNFQSATKFKKFKLRITTRSMTWPHQLLLHLWIFLLVYTYIFKKNIVSLRWTYIFNVNNQLSIITTATQHPSNMQTLNNLNKSKIEGFNQLAQLASSAPTASPAWPQLPALAKATTVFVLCLSEWCLSVCVC